MTTPLYPTFRKRIEDSAELLIQNQVTPWAFLHSGKPMTVKMFSGKPIAYQNIGFEGSPEHVFWGRYMEPFLEHLTVAEIAAAVAMARERDVDGVELLDEVGNLLKAACSRVFQEMATIDQRLRGHGYPERVHKRSIDGELARMCSFIDQHTSAEIAMWKPQRSAEEWYGANKFWVWLIGLAIAAAGVLVKLS